MDNNTARAAIREAIKSLVAESLSETNTRQAIVKTVDKDAGTLVATGEVEGIDYFDVRLRSYLGDDNSQGLMLYPELGSRVLLVQVEGQDCIYFVAQYSDIESFRLTVSNGVSIELTADGKLLLNGDALGGLVKVGELVKRLNALEERMATHQHLVGKVPTLPDLLTNPPLAPTTAIQLANPNVQHG